MKTSIRIYITLVITIVLIAIYRYLPLILNANDDAVVIIGFILMPIPALSYIYGVYRIWQPIFKGKQTNNDSN